MATIEERAREYEILHIGHGKDFCVEDFILGARSEHAELTSWNSPECPPDNDKPVLLKAEWAHGIYYRVGRYFDGRYINDSCVSAKINVIGWREIHE